MRNEEFPFTRVHFMENSFEFLKLRGFTSMKKYSFSNLSYILFCLLKKYQ